MTRQTVLITRDFLPYSEYFGLLLLTETASAQLYWSLFLTEDRFSANVNLSFQRKLTREKMDWIEVFVCPKIIITTLFSTTRFSNLFN